LDIFVVLLPSQDHGRPTVFNIWSRWWSMSIVSLSVCFFVHPDDPLLVSEVLLVDRLAVVRRTLGGVCVCGPSFLAGDLHVPSLFVIGYEEVTVG
jgi:hypothetical protein